MPLKTLNLHSIGHLIFSPWWLSQSRGKFCYCSSIAIVTNQNHKNICCFSFCGLKTFWWYVVQRTTARKLWWWKYPKQKSVSTRSWVELSCYGDALCQPTVDSIWVESNGLDLIFFKEHTCLKKALQLIKWAPARQSCHRTQIWTESWPEGYPSFPFLLPSLHLPLSLKTQWQQEGVKTFL